MFRLSLRSGLARGRSITIAGDYGSAAYGRLGGTGRPLELPNVPDIASVLRDAAVAGELADARDVQYGLAPPDLFVEVFAVNQLLRLDVAGEIGDMEVAVAAMHQLVEDPAEQPVLIGTEAVGGERVHDFAGLQASLS